MSRSPADPRDALLVWAYRYFAARRYNRCAEAEFMLHADAAMPGVAQMAVCVSPDVGTAVRQAREAARQPFTPRIVDRDSA